MKVSSPVSPEPAALSRRTMVGAGATGLALALLARSQSQAAAQEASPAAEGGMPEGLAVLTAGKVPVPAADVPAGGVTVGITRLAIEPGASAPVATLDHAVIDHVESGVLICPGGAPRFLYAADGSVREVGDEDVTLNVGDSIYIPPNVADGGRNEGTELLTVLRVELMPMEAGMATPSA